MEEPIGGRIAADRALMREKNLKSARAEALSAVKVAGAYAASALLWFGATNFLLYHRVSDARLLFEISAARGLFFIALTAVMLYHGISGLLERNDEAMSALSEQFRAVQLINACDSAVWTSRTQQELFTEICRLAVEEGGYRAAWVAIAQHDSEKNIRPSAAAGMERDFIDALKLTWDDGPQGAGPTGTAIRTGKPDICRFMESGPRTARWSEAVRRAGFKSAASFPLNQGGRTVGAFALYSDRPDAFDVSEASQLNRLAKSISYALDYFEKGDKERMLVEELQKLAHAVDGSPVSVVITDTKGNIEFVNRKFTEVTGYSAEEVLGKNSRILKSGETSGDEYRRLWETISGGGVWKGVFHNRRKNGETFWEMATISPVKCPDGNIRNFIAVKEDITEKRSLEQQLRQAQKMESLGALAGGVAHDFNNLLTVIGGHCELLAASGLKTPGDQESVADIRAAADRAAAMTKRLLQFGRKQQMTLRHVDLGAVVWESVRMLRRLLGETYTLELKRPDSPLFLTADASMIEQVVMNLVVNARDAMPKGGKITVRISPAESEVAAPHGIGPGPQSYIALSVTDEGSGIEPGDLQRIFEPFFTTKDIGKGTGLGLSVVDGIVRQHGGWVWVDSTVGKGSVFTVYLPLGVKPSDEAPAPALTAPVRGTERILLVEDDGALRALAARVLASLGYAVTEAASGPAALESWNKRKEPFRLLLTDMVMPGGVSGSELARKLRAEDPGLRVLITSGYHRELPSTAREGFAFLPKPFAIPSLARAVRAELDRDPVAA